MSGFLLNGICRENSLVVLQLAGSVDFPTVNDLSGICAQLNGGVITDLLCGFLCYPFFDGRYRFLGVWIIILGGNDAGAFTGIFFGAGRCS